MEDKRPLNERLAKATDEDYLDTYVAAKYLRLSKNTLRGYRSKGKDDVPYEYTTDNLVVYNFGSLKAFKLRMWNRRSIMGKRKG